MRVGAPQQPPAPRRRGARSRVRSNVRHGTGIGPATSASAPFRDGPQSLLELLNSPARVLPVARDGDEGGLRLFESSPRPLVSGPEVR